MGNEFTNKILKLALPITAQQFMLALVSACDAFMLGRLNQNSLSAISLALLESDRNSHPKTSRINQSESDRNSQS